MLSSPAVPVLVTAYAHGCSCVCTQPGYGHLQVLADTVVKRLLTCRTYALVPAELSGAEGTREGPLAERASPAHLDALTRCML